MDIFNISPVAALGHLARRYRAARAESRTRRLIEALPRHIRKDIGWPDTSRPLADGKTERGWLL